MMIAATGAPEAVRREAKLSEVDRTDARRWFVRLAHVELDRAFRLAGLVLGDQAEAEDAVQDALLRGWRAADSLRDPAGFQAWFDRILVNVCRDRLRRRRRVRFIRLDGEDHGAALGDPFREVLDRDEALRAMTALSVDERMVIVLHYWADLTLEATADRLGWPVGTVKSRLNRALEGIRQELAGAPRPDDPR